MNNYKPKLFDKLSDKGVLKKTGDSSPYIFNDKITIAVDVALATERPLLVSGNPGTGKSRLADAIAEVQGWNLLRTTLTSRTRAASLTAEVDQLRRLNDAQARSGDSNLKPDNFYLNPGIFWWAYSAETASRRGMKQEHAEKFSVELPYPGINRKKNQVIGTVLLIDEIDKAEPDLPNDLLEPLDIGRFYLPEGYEVAEQKEINRNTASNLLTIITTNGERELPEAFLRRCILLNLPDPDKDELVDIAEMHHPDIDKELIKEISVIFDKIREHALKMQKRPAGTSEFLDAVRACDELDITVSEDKDSIWKMLESAVLVKNTAL